ncbi:type II toxin-antitoxin system RelE/ParE family toxin [Bacteroides sp. 519]|uniref:type II toxin-antitoxin system RelE/ParE family toxin n=1 Tax=Bacteroides sp. 519 TaxID=2302937 RepID=UPI0013D05DE0|nr:type II toxin-antitoxin system RelE/ParE family toxin [Bacteroides sp. 519]NDV58421.1 type II toxin-antitoxin system RelE/ParE family toxin [Bacteroides sp. 519]
MVIKWTPLARRSLKDVYLFYLPQTGKKKALEIINQIKDETNYLLIFPEMGAFEVIDEIKTPYRYIIKNKCKLYYSVLSDYIRVDFVWDTRRNPEYLRQYLID